MSAIGLTCGQAAEAMESFHLRVTGTMQRLGFLLSEEAELEEAMTRHEGETLHRHHTGAALAEAIDRYRRFTNHGIIPEDIAEDEGDL